jgi:hypothetical protein
MKPTICLYELAMNRFRFRMGRLTCKDGGSGQARQIDPTGKSLLIYGNRVKAKINWNQKYFAFPE